MTKKDGDKLRSMRTELLRMSNQYERNSLTARDMRRIAGAISAALAGKKFTVGGVNVSEMLRQDERRERLGIDDS
jgi:hypothetical protein